MRGRTDRDRVTNAIAPLAYDERERCCAANCIKGLVTSNDLDHVVDAIMCERRGILCGDQNQKMERLRELMNKSYDPDTREQEFFFYNRCDLHGPDNDEEIPDRFKVSKIIQQFNVAISKHPQQAVDCRIYSCDFLHLNVDIASSNRFNFISYNTRLLTTMCKNH